MRKFVIVSVSISTKLLLTYDIVVYSSGANHGFMTSLTTVDSSNKINKKIRTLCMHNKQQKDIFTSLVRLIVISLSLSFHWTCARLALSCSMNESLTAELRRTAAGVSSRC